MTHIARHIFDMLFPTKPSKPDLTAEIGHELDKLRQTRACVDNELEYLKRPDVLKNLAISMNRSSMRGLQ